MYLHTRVREWQLKLYDTRNGAPLIDRSIDDHHDNLHQVLVVVI